MVPNTQPEVQKGTHTNFISATVKLAVWQVLTGLLNAQGGARLRLNGGFQSHMGSSGSIVLRGGR